MYVAVQTGMPYNNRSRIGMDSNWRVKLGTYKSNAAVSAVVCSVSVMMLGNLFDADSSNSSGRQIMDNLASAVFFAWMVFAESFNAKPETTVFLGMVNVTPGFLPLELGLGPRVLAVADYHCSATYAITVRTN